MYKMKVFKPLMGYMDKSYGGFPNAQRSITRSLPFFMEVFVTWRSKKHKMISSSCA